jgi:hypothetical protein
MIEGLNWGLGVIAHWGVLLIGMMTAVHMCVAL